MTLDQMMHLWARWREDEMFYGWPPTTTLGKIVDGLPSLKCVRCNGKGSLPLMDGGKEECPVCLGDGKVKASPGGVKAHPGLIRSTATMGYGRFDNDLMGRIDNIVNSIHFLTDKQRNVVRHNYYLSKNRKEAVKKLKITYRDFGETLDSALKIIDGRLKDE